MSDVAAAALAPVEPEPVTIFGMPVAVVGGLFRLLPDRPVCHGRACGCVCSRCDRRPKSAPAPTRQPWQPVVIAGGASL